MQRIPSQIAESKSSDADFATKIQQVKNEKNAVILAHYYQQPAIQDIADFVGDSLELSRKASHTDADIIVFAGVHFMAETAKIINPGKKVLVPDLEASCSLAESCPPNSFEKFVKDHPDHGVVTYINCSAEIKALSDIVCTSSNAIKVINSIPKEVPIIFAPDRNLGEYIIKETGRDLLLWDGACMVHEAFALDKILDLHKLHPAAEFIAHPESSPEILSLATYIGSTSGIINYVKNSASKAFIIGTEAGILHELQKEAPEKQLIAAPSVEDNTCACSECYFMKMNTLEKVLDCLLIESPSVNVSEDIRERAILPINRMLDLS